MSKRWRIAAATVLFEAILLSARGASAQGGAAVGGRGPGIDWNARSPFGPFIENVPADTPKTPFKIFDEVYYVGVRMVSAYLVRTDAGLVLIDSTYSNTVNQLLDNIRTLGFDPVNVKYVFVTHSHPDHYGGAAAIKQLSGARVGMSAPDWDVVEQGAARGSDGAARLARDLALKDGETIAVGNVPFTFYLTPGHTPGATSIAFPVHDRGKTYRALAPGGLGLQFGPQWTVPFINSLERLEKLGPWDAVLGNHPFLSPRFLFDTEKALATRGQGAHPAIVGPSAVTAWLEALLKTARDKLASEQASSR